MKRLVPWFVLLISFVICSVSYSKGNHTFLTAEELKWVTAPPTLPAGAQMAILEGNPKLPGPFTVRFKVPAGYKIPPHIHPADEHVTVISGSFNVGLGSRFDESKGKLLPAGSFSLVRAGTKHFVWTTEDTVVQIHGIGPWGIHYVNPADKNPGHIPIFKRR